MKKRKLLLITLFAVFAFSSPWNFAEENFQALGKGFQPSKHQNPRHVSRGETIARWLENHGVSRPLAIAAISTLPIVELRGAVPVGHILYETGKMDQTDKVKTSLWIFAASVAGNMIPIPLILLLLGPVSDYLMRFRTGKKFFDWLFARTRKKSANIEKYEALGLTVFVAIPLPITGGWTGAIAAFLMGTSFWHALLCILLGVMIAGVIMTVLSLMGWVGAIIAGGALLTLAASAALKGFNHYKKNNS